MPRTAANTPKQPGRATRALMFLYRLIRATRTLGREIKRANALRVEYNRLGKKFPATLEDLNDDEYAEVYDRNEWTLDQLIDIAGRMEHRIAPSQIMRASIDAVADAAAIGELDLSMCRSEAELKARLLTRLLIYSQRERDQAAAPGGEG